MAAGAPAPARAAPEYEELQLEAVAERLSDGSAQSMCPSAPTHDRRTDVRRLSCLIFIIKCRCL